MMVRKQKPPEASPTFEKANLERIKRSSETVESAKHAVEKSRKLTQEASGIIGRLRKRKAG